MNWVADRDASIPITATRFDTEDDDFGAALTASIANDGQTPILANLPMGGFRHTGVGAGVAATDYARLDQVQGNPLSWVAAGGTADALTATYSPAVTTLTDGMLLRARASAANATTTPTFAPNGLTARTITKLGGTALLAGDISGAGHELLLVYRLSATRWELIDPASALSNGAAVAGRDNVNPFVNPDAAVAQIGASIASGSLNDNAYCSDGTRVLLEANGDCSYSQAGDWAANGFLYSDKLTIVTTNKKFGFFKPIEQRDLGPLAVSGTSVIASAYIIASASLGTIKMGLIAWNGTADAITADPISAWNGDGVAPTLAAGWAFVNTPANLSVTAGFARYSVVGAIPASTNNLAMLVWNDDKVTTAADALWVTGYDLRRGGTLLPFEPVNFQANLSRCQRYAPVFDAALATNSIFGSGFAASTTVAGIAVPFKVTARIAPTGITVSNPTNFQLSKLLTTVNATAVAFQAAGVDLGQVNITVASGMVAGEACLFRANNTNCRVEFTGARL